jgi:glycosyltransferase involved in cell wall biosynthesis
VSVVIASVNGLPSIQECLEALTRQDSVVSAEILVADRCGESVRSFIASRFPSVRVLASEAGTSIPALRATAMAQAKGRLVAVIEDHCLVRPDWFRMIERHADTRGVVGGAVENGSVARTTDWAAFFCEYARFMPPIPRGDVPCVTGNNTVYGRDVLDLLGPALYDEVWESFLHERMRRLGVRFLSEPDLVVVHKKEFGFRYFLSQRYHYSRSFAGMRMAKAPAWRRLAYAAATPALPLVLLARTISIVAAKGGLGARFLSTLPALAAFFVSWAWGETVGALLGPGRSLARVE